ncbi:hypothetical protein COCSADRAFT_42090, partial [Bipolaris sorokiniana ND90Pr]
IIAAVKSGDSTRTCSASISLFTHNMLRIGHLPSRQVDGTILVHLWWSMGVVSSRPWILRACGSWTATTDTSCSSSSFIKLSCTSPCFLTLSWITWNALFMLRRV